MNKNRIILICSSIIGAGLFVVAAAMADNLKNHPELGASYERTADWIIIFAFLFIIVAILSALVKRSS